MHQLENEHLAIKVKTKGAELCSLVNKNTGLEYIWQANPLFWGKHAPILFPIVGKLKNDIYKYNDSEYTMTQHGFARDFDFELTNTGNRHLQFTLKSNDKTREIYPFDFKLDIIFSFQQNELSVLSRVTNCGSTEMYFSIGYHPAFRVPLLVEEQYDDYFLEFNKSENLARWNIDGGLIADQGDQVLQNETKIQLSRVLFQKDALVFKSAVSDEISLRSLISNHGLSCKFKNYPYLGIWAKQEADFICLEPWQGIADSVYGNQNLKEKEGILKLEVNEQFECGYSIFTF